MREAPNCAKKVRKTTGCADMCENGLKCENVRETAKSAIPPHLNFASDTVVGNGYIFFEIK